MTPTSHIDWHGEEFTAEIEQEVSNRMFRAGVIILSAAQKSMAKRNKAGKARMHKRLKSGKISKKQFSRYQQTQRSAPGQPPAVQTGRLQSSLSFMSGEGGLEKLSPLRWRLGTNVEYAKYLEPKTRGKYKQIKPRPFLKPAVAKTKKRIERLFAREKI